MTAEITSEEFKVALQDAEVQALIISKISAMKTEGLAESLTAQYKSLGIITDSAESASTSDAATDESAADTATVSAEATA